MKKEMTGREMIEASERQVKEMMAECFRPRKTLFQKFIDGIIVELKALRRAKL